MKLVIPDNNDPKLIDVVAKLVKKSNKHKISEIYGKPTSNTFIGSGRANVLFDDMSRKDLNKRIEAFEKLGILYEYSLNGILPRTRVIENRTKIIEELKWLESSSISKITVANYELAKLAEIYAPSVDLSISFYAGVNSERRFIQWANLPNVKTINTDLNTYRNFPLLEKLVNLGKSFEVGIRVIANLGCMTDCARKEEHAIIKDMASTDKDSLHYAPCTFYCRKKLLENPTELLKLALIRPENLDVYENLGVESVKLVDRTQKTIWLKDIINYYLNGSYEGNILDLTCNFASHQIDDLSNEDVKKIDVNEVIKTREGVFEYKEKLPKLMDLKISKKYNFLKCNNVCDSCKIGCNESMVKYNKKRVNTVLNQLKELEQLYLFK